jgi:hypothetical protein
VRRQEVGADPGSDIFVSSNYFYLYYSIIGTIIGSLPP